MTDSAPIRTLSQLLQDLKDSFSGDKVTVDHILVAFHERGFGFFLFVFALPMALPLPVPPGINILLASPLLLMTAQQAIGRQTIWLPESMKKRSFTTQKMSRIIDMATPWMKRLESIISPRLGFVTQGVFSNFIGILGFIMALSICIPLPLTNTVPSFGIALMAIGVLLRDGLAVIVGAIIGSAWVVMLVSVTIFLGAEGIDLIKSTVKSFF
ncbi:MAG: exopolysaccharide biosynthesis protein [Pseudomonadota bacterium]